MAKYDCDFKLEVVKLYLNGDGGYKVIADKSNIRNKSQIDTCI